MAPCKFFSSGRPCPYGSRCKFSHDRTTETRPRQTSRSDKKHSTAPLSTSEAELRAWQLSIPRAPFSDPGSAALKRFFVTARKLVSEDASIQQDVIKRLASEGGLQRIRQLADQEHTARSLPKSAVFRDQILPLFGAITHSDIVDSAVLEQDLGTIFNYICGNEGQRMIKLFGVSVDALHELLSLPHDSELEDLGELFEPPLNVFIKILEVNSPAQVNQNLHPLVMAFADLIAKKKDAEDGSSLHDATILLGHVQHRLGLGSNLPTASAAKKPDLKKASFKVQQDGPGGRHDNDFIDFAEIHIMPTAEEIMSQRNDYLPLNDAAENIFQGLDALLDRNFRLLRADTIGPLRDAVKMELDRLRGGTRNEASRRKQQEVFTKRYNAASVDNIYADEREGIKFDVTFDQPANFAAEKERKEWWTRSKRLEPDALVCLVDSRGTGTFCTVDPNSKPRERSNGSSNSKHANLPDQQSRKLYVGRTKASITLHLESKNAVSIRQLLGLYRMENSRVSLVEFGGIVLPSFKPTLEALQHMKKTGDLPFRQLLATDEDQSDVILSPPAYALRPRFRFNLRCLTKKKEDLFFSPKERFNMETLQAVSTLDDAQATAVAEALSRELALIQGPPGTGKSFVGVALVRTLLANKKSKSNPQGADIGPIIIVCYTNHALDQLLEHLVDAGLEQIIRVGSRSKSRALEECNLRAVAKKSGRTKSEGYSLAMLHKDLEEDTLPQLRRVLHDVSYANSWGTLKKHVQQKHLLHYVGLFEKDEDSWDTARPKKPQKVFREWLQSGSSRPTLRPLHELHQLPVSLMSREERKSLFDSWNNRIRDSLSDRLRDAIRRHEEVKRGFDRIHSDVDLRCLKTANIIGLTTSGLARNLSVLRKVKPHVLLCEEAGEVLESHLLTAFLPSITHAILIGDHLQLRPQIQNYELSKENPRGEQYSLDLSLFERLVQPPSNAMARLPYSTLETQRRMHPSISRLIRETLYPTLQDWPAVMTHPQVVGMKERLFWLDHSHSEASRQSEFDSTSHWNQFEIDMTAAIVSHLVRQGEYQSDDIAVLTPYLGQLHRLRSVLSSSFAIVLGERDQEGLEKAGLDGTAPQDSDGREISKTTLLKALRIATVDNFQGEEAKVVVISLVRSNEEKKCGFLRTSNRINVLLSRAKHGMYIVGDSRTAGHRVAMWADVIAMLTADGKIGPSLELQCPRHPDSPIAVSTPDDFLRVSPEGGCNLKCIDRLQCGHACKSMCHSKVLHNAVHCLEPCPRSRAGCDHACPGYCGDPCPVKCMVDVFDPSRILPCGHEAKHLPCWQAQDLSRAKCFIKVQKLIPGCQHTVTEPCHVDISSANYVCKAQCGTVLQCGHSCKNECRKCRQQSLDGSRINVDHGDCKQVCGRPYATCAHGCTQYCHEGRCGPCRAPCEVQCSHSKCSKKCSQPCRPCAEPKCASSCPHSQCSQPCAAPCDHIPCSKRCSQVLSCGHQCPSVCGEACPDSTYCQTCGTDDIKDTGVDFIEGLTYREIDLDTNPCIFPQCGHFLTTESMDTQMGLQRYYEVNEAGVITALKSGTSEPFAMDEIKSCAICRGSLRGLARYGRLVRRAWIDEVSKKFIDWSSKEYVLLAEKLLKETQALSDAPDDVEMIKAQLPGQVKLEKDQDTQLRAFRKLKRYKPMLQLYSLLVQYHRAVRKEEQPLMKVWEMVQNARRRQGRSGAFEFDRSVVQTKGQLQAFTLLLRCILAIFTDFLCLLDRAPAGAIVHKMYVDLSDNRLECDQLVALAEASKRPVQQVEGHVFLVQFAALERAYATPDKSTALLTLGHEHLDIARHLCAQYPGSTAGMSAEVDRAAAMLMSSTHYTPVTADEMHAVMSAIAHAKEYSGSTGHWYTCENGHPFNIGNCGLANQRGVCPECGANMGGERYQMVEGVGRAEGLDQQFAQMHV